MDIAKLSMDMSAAKVEMGASVAVTKMNMDTQKDLAQTVISDLLGVNVASAGHVDISV